MVDYRAAELDATFAALSDPTRRALLARLNEDEGVSITELARPFAMSLPAVMKHLDVLAEAGLIERTKVGRTVTCRLTAEPMEQAMHWLTAYQRFWTSQLDRLAKFLEEGSCPPNQSSTQNRASPSNVVSMRPPKGSTRRGRTPRKS